MVCGIISIVTGAYKPTYNWGGPHCIVFFPSPKIGAADALSIELAMDHRAHWAEEKKLYEMQRRRHGKND